MDLNWTNPGPAEKAITAEFIQSKEAREIREIFPEPIPYDSEHSRFVASASAMGKYETNTSALAITPPDTCSHSLVASYKCHWSHWNQSCQQSLVSRQPSKPQARGGMNFATKSLLHRKTTMNNYGDHGIDSGTGLGTLQKSLNHG